MDQTLINNFVIHETLKDASTHKPEGFNDIFLWNAIWKAHLDTMTGARFHGNTYLANSKKEEPKIQIQLYCIIKNAEENLCSEYLLDKLGETSLIDPSEYGFAQKIVNMTLKYLIMLNAFGKTSFEIDEKQCDCPLDSQILERLHSINEKTYKKWTQLEKEDYTNIQRDIKKCLGEESSKGNMYFDYKYYSNDNDVT